MPCMSTQSINDDVFIECLGFLAATIEELDCTCITIIGDWNADVSNDKHQFGNYLNQFCSDIGLIISSELKLPEDSFTYKSDSWHTTSWIDHCFPRRMVMILYMIMEILYPESTGDHVPFRLGVSIERIPTLDESSSNSINRLDWSRLRGFAKLKFFQKSKNNLDRAQPTHPPPYPIFFFFWKPISGMARTLKSQLLITYRQNTSHYAHTT